MTALDLASRYIGIREIASPGGDHPLIQWWLSLCGFSTDAVDETPWCSAFVNGIAWELRLPRSKSAAARSWLKVGMPVTLGFARPGFDVVILKRGAGDQPGPETLDAPGHVGWFAGVDSGDVIVLAGNQGDAISMERFHPDRVLGIRRLFGVA